MSLRFTPWFLIASVAAVVAVVAVDAGAGEWLTESRFQLALQRPLIATRSIATPVREYLDRLAEERQVAVLLDRRIDPSRPVRVQLKAATFEQGIRELADQVDGQVSVLADTVYVGPVRTAGQVRTLAWLKGVQLSDLTKGSLGREVELVRRRPVIWEDLQEPRQLVLDVAAAYGLKVEDPELIPHDLWAQGSIAHANAAEALLMLLMQFDLSFEWTGGATGIRIVPAPKRVTIQREHAVPRNQRETILERLQADYPDVIARLRGARLQVDATLDEHDAIESILRGDTGPQVVDPGMISLRKKIFSPTIDRKPAGALLVTLQAEGVDLRFDNEQLAAAGVDLRQLISMRLTKVPIDKLLDELCRQVRGLTYRIEGETVYMEARP